MMRELRAVKPGGLIPAWHVGSGRGVGRPPCSVSFAGAVAMLRFAVAEFSGGTVRRGGGVLRVEGCRLLPRRGQVPVWRVATWPLLVVGAGRHRGRPVSHALPAEGGSLPQGSRCAARCARRPATKSARRCPERSWLARFHLGSATPVTSRPNSQLRTLAVRVTPLGVLGVLNF